MEDQQELTLSKYCRVIGIDLIKLSKKTAVAIKDINVLYQKSIADFEIFALKNQFKFKPMYAMSYIPPAVNNNKLVTKYPFKFTLVDSEGNPQKGTLLTSKESTGIKLLKIKYPRSTKHKLVSMPNSWISGVK